MGTTITRPLGTEDITPKEIHQWYTVESLTREAAESFGFREIRIPTFEQTNLFLRSVGETTDVVQKEMYTVKARESEFTLRPEGTAGTIRALIQNGLLGEALPQKVYYQLSCFRHERPQAGRLREFHQFGVEMAGSADPAADVDVITLAKTILDKAGLKWIELHINSIGCPKCRNAYTKALREYFQPVREELCPTCQERLQKNPMRILDCKSPICGEIAKGAPLISDYLCDECQQHFETLQKSLRALEIDFTIDPKLVRGLDYYTKTVFEFISQDIGAQGTVCAGGRYDGLIEQLGGKPTPAIGFAMGFERLILTMRKQKCPFDPPKMPALYVATLGERATMAAMQICQMLRQSDYCAEYDLMHRSLKAQMKYANKIGAMFVLVIGDNEIDTRRAKLRNMSTGEETEIALDETFESKFDDLAVPVIFREFEPYDPGKM